MSGILEPKDKHYYHDLMRNGFIETEANFLIKNIKSKYQICILNNTAFGKYYMIQLIKIGDETEIIMNTQISKGNRVRFYECLNSFTQHALNKIRLETNAN